MPRNPDIHEGICKRCQHRYYRDLTYVQRKNASEETVFAQICAIIRPYCSWRCIPWRLKQRVLWLIDNPQIGLTFSLPVPDPLEEEGVLDESGNISTGIEEGTDVRGQNGSSKPRKRNIQKGRG